MTTTSIAAPTTRGARLGASLRRNRRWALIMSYVFLIMFAIFFLMPPYYMIVTALKSDAEVAHMATNPWIIANGVTLDQFKILLFETDFLIFFKNTVIVTVCVVAITMVVSVLAAFSLGRMKFWGSSILATGIFLTYLMPDTLLFHPAVPDRQIGRPAQFLLGHGADLSDADGAVLYLDHDRLFPVDPQGTRRGGAD